MSTIRLCFLRISLLLTVFRDLIHGLDEDEISDDLVGCVEQLYSLDLDQMTLEAISEVFQVEDKLEDIYQALADEIRLEEAKNDQNKDLRQEEAN